MEKQNKTEKQTKENTSLLVDETIMEAIDIKFPTGFEISLRSSFYNAKELTTFAIKKFNELHNKSNPKNKNTYFD